MNILLTITTTTLRMLVRNRQSLFFTWFLPLTLMLVIGFVTKSGDVKIAVGVVYNHEDTISTQLVDGLKKVAALDITTGSEKEEKDALSDNKRDLVVQFPNELRLIPPTAPGATQAEPTHITFYENLGKPTQANIGEMIIQQFFQQAQAGSAQQPSAIIYERTQISASSPRYIDFLVPGIIAMTIMQLGIFGTAFAIVDAKQKGVLKRVMATPVAPWQYIMGNMIARLILSMSQSAILVGVATLVFDVHFQHWGWLVGLVVLGNIVFLSLGLFISGVAKTTETVPVLGNLIVFPMLLLGGIFFQTSSLPEWLKFFVDKLPVALLSDLMRSTVTLDKGLSDVWVSLLMLAVWAVICLILANVFFKLQEKE